MTELRGRSWKYRNWETKRVIFEVEVLVPVGASDGEIEAWARDAVGYSEGSVVAIAEPK